MRVTILVITLFIYSGTLAQRPFNDSIAFARNNLKQKDMVGLGSFALVNIASGFIVANSTHGEAKYFWRMNAYWNFFNLGVAGLGYIAARKDLLKRYSFSENYAKQQKIEKIYVFNAGLDVAYIATGLLLRQKGKLEAGIDSRDKLNGFGASITAQGGVLLLMDCAMIALHHKNTVRMGNKLHQIELSAAPGLFSLTYKL